MTAIRLLTEDEVRAIRVTHEARDEAAAIQRLFCAVNGFPAPGAPDPEARGADFEPVGRFVAATHDIPVRWTQVAPEYENGPYLTTLYRKRGGK